MCQKLIGLHPASPYSSPQPVYGLRSVCVCVCESAHIHTSADTDAHAFSVTDTFSQEFPSQIAGTTYPRQKTPS